MPAHDDPRAPVRDECGIRLELGLGPGRGNVGQTTVAVLARPAMAGKMLQRAVDARLRKPVDESLRVGAYFRGIGVERAVVMPDRRIGRVVEIDHRAQIEIEAKPGDLGPGLGIESLSLRRRQCLCNRPRRWQRRATVPIGQSLDDTALMVDRDERLRARVAKGL